MACVLGLQTSSTGFKNVIYYVIHIGDLYGLRDDIVRPGPSLIIPVISLSTFNPVIRELASGHSFQNIGLVQTCYYQNLADLDRVSVT